LLIPGTRRLAGPTITRVAPLGRAVPVHVLSTCCNISYRVLTMAHHVCRTPRSSRELVRTAVSGVQADHRPGMQPASPSYRGTVRVNATSALALMVPARCLRRATAPPKRTAAVARVLAACWGTGSSRSPLSRISVRNCRHGQHRVTPYSVLRREHQPRRPRLATALSTSDASCRGPGGAFRPFESSICVANVSPAWPASRPQLHARFCNPRHSSSGIILSSPGRRGPTMIRRLVDDRVERSPALRLLDLRDHRPARPDLIHNLVAPIDVRG